MTKRTSGNRILAMVLSFALVFTMAVQGVGFGTSADAASVFTNENLTKHSDFEETDVSLPAGGLPSGQQRDNWYAYSGPVKTQEEAHGGDWSVKLPQTYASLEQDVPNLQQGVTYVFTVWAKVNAVNAGDSARLGVKNYGGNQIYVEVKSTEWQQYTLEFTYGGSQDARCYAYMNNAAGGTILYIDDLSLTVKGDIASAGVENGSITVGYADSYTGTPDAADFTASYSSSTAAGEVKDLPLTQSGAGDKSLVMGFAPIEAEPVEQTITVNLTYVPSGQVITLDYVIPASGGEVVEGRLASLSAENGSAVATLEEVPTVAPAAGDFTWQYSVNGGAYMALTVSDFAYDASAKTVTVSFARIAGLPTGAQEITVKAVYNETEAEASFTVEQGESTTYYVDATNGSDQNDGTSPETAFQSIDKLNTLVFQPGDQILFKKGETFVGGFQPNGSGIEGFPIVVASYGEGDRPVLKPGEAWQIPYLMSAGQTVMNPWVNHVIKFYNQEYWEVKDLELYDPTYADNGTNTNVYRSGICVSAENAGELNHFYFDNLIVHGFRGPGSNIGKTSGGIVMNVYRDPAKTGAEQISTAINDIHITNCEIYDVGRSGVNFLTPWARRSETGDSKWGSNYMGNHAPNSAGFAFNPYKNFYFANNIVHDVDGDGLIVDNNSNAVVENNLVYRTCVRPGGFGASVGMFNWNSDDTYFQNNEVYGILMAGDAQGIEIDALNDRTWVQYNYLHDNAGGLMMWCNTSDGIRSFDGIVRYNISQNDGVGHGLFDMRSANYGTEFYNNTIYLKPDVLNDDGQIKLFGYVGAADTPKFYNNIFYYTGEQAAPINNFGNAIIDWRSNIFYNISNLPENDDQGAPNVNADPLFADPGKGTSGTQAGERVDLSGYALKEGSPAINAGVPLENNGGRDYFGNPVSGIPDIGAYESGSSSLKIFSTEYTIDQAEQKISMDKKDKVTVDALLSSLRYDVGVTVRVYRGEGEIVGSTRLATGDTVKVSGNGGVAVYTVEVAESGSTNEIPVDGITATAGSYHSGQGPENVLDGNPGTLWHTEWGGSPRADHYITFDLGATYQVDGLRYLPRSAGGVNGIITKYRVDVSMTGNDDDWTAVATGDWANDSTWKTASFEAAKARYVKLVSLESRTQEAGNEYTSAAEIRLTGSRYYDDNQAPTAPANVKAADVTETTAVLSWNASNDNVGVDGYVIKNGDTEIATVGSDLLAYTVTGLQANMEYTLSVYAFDEAGNLSEAGSVTFTTGKTGAVNKGTLEMVIYLADAHVANGDVDKLVPSAKEKFEAVLKAAKDIYADDNATQEQVDQAWKDLMNAIQGLSFEKGDKTELIKLLAEMNSVNLDAYMDGAEKEAFVTAKEDAQRVIDDPDALASDVTAAMDTLQAAYDALVPVPESGDKTQLKTVVAVAKGYDQSIYVDDDNLKAFNEILARAEAMCESGGRETQEEIDAMRMELLTAMASIRLRADKSNLEDWLTKLKEFDLSGYSAETVSYVRSIIAAAEALMAQDLGTDQETLIQAAIDELEAAYARLQAEDPDPDPEDPSSGSSDPSSGEGSGKPSSEESSSGGKTPTTGDSAPAAAVSVFALAAAGALLLFKKREKMN